MFSELRGHFSIPDNRMFGFVACFFFALIAGVPLLSGGTLRFWAVCLASLFGVVSIIKPSALTGLNILWARFGLLLHRISSPVILAVIFFMILTPFSVIMRLFRKDALQLHFDRYAESYWIICDQNDQVGRSMKNQF